jgi:hypothetical protein
VNEKDEGKCKDKSLGSSNDGRIDWLKMVREEKSMDIE